MERLHIYNTLGQPACSEDFHKNSYNEVFLPDDFYSMDKKKFCYACAWNFGKPYFSDELLFEMELTEPEDSLGEDMPLVFEKMDIDDDDDVFSHVTVVRLRKPD